MAATHFSKSILPTIRSLNLRNDFFAIDACHGVLIVADVALGRVKVLAASFSNNLEAVYFGFVVVNFRGQDDSLRIVL